MCIWSGSLAAAVVSWYSYSKWRRRIIRNSWHRKTTQISVFTFMISWLSSLESLRIAQIRSCMAFQASRMSMKWSAFPTRTRRYMHRMKKTMQCKIRANKWTACSTWVISNCVIFIKGKQQYGKQDRSLKVEVYVEMLTRSWFSFTLPAQENII
jgi:hypothetical protein